MGVVAKTFVTSAPDLDAASVWLSDAMGVAGRSHGWDAKSKRGLGTPLNAAKLKFGMVF